MPSGNKIFLKFAPVTQQRGLARRVPPAIFPALMGVFGLGLAWRTGAAASGFPEEAGEVILGAAALLFVFSAMAYGIKLIHRPGVLAEELRTVPGRGGVSAGAICLYLLALALTPLLPAAAGGALIVGLALHVLLLAVLVRVLVTGAAEQRKVSPVWHLAFAGPVVAAFACSGPGWEGLGRILFGASAIAAVAIWALSAAQASRERYPAPLRPLLAIHLAPSSFLGIAADALGYPAAAEGFALISAVLLAALVAGSRWLTKGGFSALWAAFTFPVAATAVLWQRLGGVWEYPGIAVLLAATVIVVPIAVKVLRAWLDGSLAMKTNAAVA